MNEKKISNPKQNVVYDSPLHRLNGQSTVQHWHPLQFPFVFPLPPQEHVPLPLRIALMATTTRANTTNSTMTVGQFMR